MLSRSYLWITSHTNSGSSLLVSYRFLNYHWNKHFNCTFVYFLFCNLLRLSLASSRKQLCYPQKGLKHQWAKQCCLKQGTRDRHHFRLKSFSVNLKSEGKDCQFCTEMGPEVDIQEQHGNPKENYIGCFLIAVTTQGRKELFWLTIQEDIIHHSSHGRLLGSLWNPSHPPQTVTLFQQLQPSQVLISLMPLRRWNQPEQSFLSFLLSRSQPPWIPSVPTVPTVTPVTALSLTLPGALGSCFL